MDLITFLNTIIDKTGSRKLPPVFCFVGKKYPSLFLYHMRKLSQKYNHEIQALDSSLVSQDASYKACLETSFLGSTIFYWLTDFAELDNKQQQMLQSYFEQYQGPHTIGFFSDKPLTAKIAGIELPNEVDYELYAQLFSLFFPEHAIKAKNSATISIFKKYKYVSLEQSCLLMNYALVLGSKKEHNLEELLETIIVPEKSLFTLSGYFFAKHDQEFFTSWSAIKDDYRDVFWTTFWSEQLFRAYCFIELMQKKDFSQAKKSAYRLPFSFVQKDWRQNTLRELKNAHDHICTIDWNIKSGLSSHFEHFYLNFFMH